MTSTLVRSFMMQVFLVSLLVGCGHSKKFIEVKAGAVSQFKKVMVVVLENESYDQAIREPFLSKLTREGASLSNMSALARPSQPNYIALTAGNTYGVETNGNVSLDVRHIGNLLEENGMSWKVYAEGWPGKCFTGPSQGAYVRKHNPFISYLNVQNTAERCTRIVNESDFANDVQNGTMPNFSFYVPNQMNNGHDTQVGFASRWMEGRFGALLQDPKFMRDMLFIVTFDEGNSTHQQIYTVLLGDQVKPGSVSTTNYNHYNLLRTIEASLGIGTLKQYDSESVAITEIWKD